MQEIKNQICGCEAEGVELYPAESRLVDQANQYHIWVLNGAMWPVGWATRVVDYDDADDLGGKQRKATA